MWEKSAEKLYGLTFIVSRKPNIGYAYFIVELIVQLGSSEVVAEIGIDAPLETARIEAATATGRRIIDAEYGAVYMTLVEYRVVGEYWAHPRSKQFREQKCYRFGDGIMGWITGETERLLGEAALSEEEPPF